MDAHYFDVIDTAEKAYVLGFIIADGHVSKRSGLMFAVLKQDQDVLYKIRSALGSTAPIKTKDDRVVTFTVVAKPLADALTRIGLDNHKTYTLNISNVLQHVPEEFKRDLVRGMFDGDGSVCVYKYPYFKKHTYHVGYTGLKNVCDFIQEAFM